MRPVLIGLAVIASLATSLIEPSGLGSIQTVAACGGVYEQECDDSQELYEEDDEARRDFEEEASRDAEQERGYESARLADEWADEFLAAEKAAAIYWRNAYVNHDFETGTRTGKLNDAEGRFIYGPYVCDPNYDDAQSGGCVPADRDYDCGELWSWGIVLFRVIGEDWMLLDDDHDGLGCEFQPS